MRKILLLAALFLLAITSSAQAARTLSVRGETLVWTTDSHPRTVIENQTAKTTTEVVKVNEYTPPKDPGKTDSFRVRPKCCVVWSNSVTISYGESQAEKEAREAKEKAEREAREKAEREAREQKEREEKEREPPPTNTAGQVLYRLNAKSAYDQYSGNTAFLKAHIDRILGYGAFAWSHYVPTGVPVVCYEDAYTRFGAHTMNPTHRAEYIASVKEDIAHGCAGIFNDDIEWEGSGQHEVGTNAEVLALIEAVRVAIGPKINQINTQWVDLWPRIKAGNATVLKSLLYIDHNDKEFGVNSSSGIGSPSSFADYCAYVDYLHAHTPNPIHIDQADSTPGDLYELGTYLLNNDGGDYIGSFVTPETWSSLYDTNLGAALGGRELIGGIYRRKFVGGTVYVDPPGGPTQTIDGHTLKGREGLIA